MCEAIFNAIYIILSLTIVFAQLVVLVPKWLKWFPFYKKALYAVDKLFRLDGEYEFLDCDNNVKVTLKLGSVGKEEKGFKELFEVIKDYRPIPDIETKTICLAFGDIPIPTSMASPNFALFIKEHGLKNPIYFDPWGSDDPLYLKTILIDWVKRRAQTEIAQYTAIVVVIWIAIMTIVIYG